MFKLAKTDFLVCLTDLKKYRPIGIIMKTYRKEDRRALTCSEQEDILSVIQPPNVIVANGDAPPPCTAPSVLNARESLRIQLQSLRLHPEVIPQLKEIVKKQYYSSLLQPGEMVGIIAASSIGEQNTQASLNSFHSSGAFKANLTGGLARLNELMNATENIKTPSLTIFFTSDVEQDLQAIRRLCFTKLVWVEVQDVLEDVSIAYQPSLTDEAITTLWYNAYSKYISAEHTVGIADWRVRLKFAVDKLWRHEIRLRDIVHKIQRITSCSDKISFVYSRDDVGIIDMWLNVTSLPELQTMLKIKPESKLNRSIPEARKVPYYINRVVIPHILQINLSGVQGIKDCYVPEKVRTTNSKGEVIQEYRVQTKGGKLSALFFIDCIDAKRCRSNDMHEVARMFGIEAVKQLLRDEFGQLIKVNPRHLELLIDSMTYTGSVQRVTRNGIDRKQVGTLAKASFEQPIDNFLISASIGEVDPLKGVSAAITVGKTARIGTGFMDIITNEPELQKMEAEIRKIEEEQAEANQRESFMSFLDTIKMNTTDYSEFEALSQEVTMYDDEHTTKDEDDSDAEKEIIEYEEDDEDLAYQ